MDKVELRVAFYTQRRTIMESSAMSVNSQRADIIGSARFLWFELAGRCNFECIHCYAESSPRKDHGNVSSSRWHELLVEAQQLKVEHIQFIGGEPTLHPSFSDLIWVCPTCLTGFPANALRIASLAAFSGDPPSATKYGINLCECRLYLILPV